MMLREAKENIESVFVYAAGVIAAHVSLDDATKLVILIMFAARAGYDGLRLYRFIKQKENQ